MAEYGGQRSPAARQLSSEPAAVSETAAQRMQDAGAWAQLVALLEVNGQFGRFFTTVVRQFAGQVGDEYAARVGPQVLLPRFQPDRPDLAAPPATALPELVRRVQRLPEDLAAAGLLCLTWAQYDGALRAFAELVGVREAVGVLLRFVYHEQQAHLEVFARALLAGCPFTASETAAFLGAEYRHVPWAHEVIFEAARRGVLEQCVQVFAYAAGHQLNAYETDQALRLAVSGWPASVAVESCREVMAEKRAALPSAQRPALTRPRPLTNREVMARVPVTPRPHPSVSQQAPQPQAVQAVRRSLFRRLDDRPAPAGVR